MRKLEEIQRIILRKICKQRKTTPYFGLLAELGIWIIGKQIEYKKIMLLLHNILTSNDDRLLKEIVKDQIKDTWPGSWTFFFIRTTLIRTSRLKSADKLRTK